MSLLQQTVVALIHDSKNKQAHHILQHLPHYESWEQLHLLKQLLCIRPPHPPLPSKLTADIETILSQHQNTRVLTQAASIPTKLTLNRPAKPPVNIKLWQGDITTLAGDVTAITNAANAQMLGCFQPTHKCIDNIIHSYAGPGLRRECFDITEARGRDLTIGEAIVTKAFCLPSSYVIHTVGPRLRRGAEPSSEEIQQLRQCYVSVLEQADSIPANEDGTKRVALCGISTGLFAFPTQLAADIAVSAVTAWVAHNEDASLTDIIFTTFVEGDYDLYSTILSKVQEPWHTPDPHASPAGALQLSSSNLETARQLLASADTVLISAGAGLSAAEGLDYTSLSLFNTHFSSFLALGLTTLYSAIGFVFPSEAEKWSYYFTNLEMLRAWPRWPLYERLLSWLEASGKDAHIRTSNADGAFLANGWKEEKLSTPQGRYAVLQCVDTCRPEATFDTLPFYKAASPFLDRRTQRLTDAGKVPRCLYCGDEVMLCVRGGDWFNDRPFEEGEKRWRKFRQGVLEHHAGNTVVLELGVGMNTPGVLRWPNEDLVRKGGGRVKLVRMGLGPSAAVPADLEEGGLAVSVEGDLKVALPWVLGTID
jgi:O-acetyl-ADP-ribose deacetylase (regulator of RNase III)/NAD-dependent SIR2 family protein deacetylase